MALTAGAPTPVLIDALARARWGVLDGKKWGGLRAVLRAIQGAPATKEKRGYFARTGEVYVTAWQISGISGLSEKWARQMLQELEGLGVITWARGMIVNGRPTCSRLKIVKAVLLDLIRFARDREDELVAERRRAFEVKMLKLRNLRVPSKGPGGKHTNNLQARNAWSIHEELTATPPLYREGDRDSAVPMPGNDAAEGGAVIDWPATSGDSGPAACGTQSLNPPTSDNSPDRMVSLFEAIMEGNEMAKLPPRPEPDPSRYPDVCPHNVGFVKPEHCIECRNAATDPAQLAAWENFARQSEGYQWKLRQEAKHTLPGSVEQAEAIADRATQIAQSEGYRGFALVKRVAELTELLRKEAGCQGALL